MNRVDIDYTEFQNFNQNVVDLETVIAARVVHGMFVSII